MKVKVVPSEWFEFPKRSDVLKRESPADFGFRSFLCPEHLYAIVNHMETPQSAGLRLNEKKCYLKNSFKIHY